MQSRHCYVYIITIVLLFLYLSISFRKYHVLQLETTRERKEVGKSLQERFESKEMPLFEDAPKACSVRNVTRTEDISETLNSIEGKPKCSLSFFDGYFKKTGQFYGDGWWHDSKQEYIPKDCVFNKNVSLKERFEECLLKNNISKILITGDSTARSLSCAMIDMLKKNVGMECTLARHSGGVSETNASYNIESEIDYFIVPSIPKRILLMPLSCGYAITCFSFQYECKFRKASKALLLEYISILRVIDITLQINRTGSIYQHILKAGSKMEYLLRYYFPFHAFPDLWIYKPHFRHEILATTVAELMVDFDYLFGLINLYLPREVKMLFIGDTRECRPPNEQERFKKRWNVYPNEKIHQFNQVLLRKLTYFQRGSPNLHAFLDGMKLTCPLECRLHRDGTHFYKIWYTDLCQYILQTICVG